MKFRAIARIVFAALCVCLIVGATVAMFVLPRREADRIREEMKDPYAFVTETARTSWAYVGEDQTLSVAHEDCLNLTVFRLPEVVNGVTVSHLGNAFSQALPKVERVILPSTVAQPKIDSSLKKWSALREIGFREGCLDLSDVMLCAGEGLEAVYLPESLSSIGGSFLREGEGSPTIYYAGTEEKWQALGSQARRLNERYTVVFERDIPTEWLESTK